MKFNETKKYAEAMEFRDWQTCDLICEEHLGLQKEISKIMRKDGNDTTVEDISKGSVMSAVYDTVRAIIMREPTFDDMLFLLTSIEIAVKNEDTYQACVLLRDELTEQHEGVL